MYPLNYFSLFPAFPRSHRAFVAMSFDPVFDARWNDVLKPALEFVEKSGAPLEPFRVDLSKASDAILTEVLQAIGDSTVVVADITSTTELNGRAVRNANVIYEVGLAHAVRLPEEVVLFRSDDHKLDFDVAGVRVHSYDPEGDPSGAIQFVTETVIDSLRALDQKRHISLRAASERLTLPATNLLWMAMAKGLVRHPSSKTMGEVLGSTSTVHAISLLLDIGAIRSELMSVTANDIENLTEFDADVLSYKPTQFGRSLVHYMAEEMGVLKPDVVEQLKKLVVESQDEA